jgi:hypothetical protein
MIGKIGYKRALLLFVLAGLLVAFYVADEYLFKPKVIESQSALNTSMGEISTLQGEIDKMRADFTLFEKQKDFYDIISRMGFFNDQDRVLARQRFDTMQKLSKIISARYEIKAANILTDEVNPETGFVVMESPITVDLAAVDDLDVYRFIYFLNYGFPGHITINSLNIERKGDVSPEVLKSIGTGKPPELITAKMELDWRTMARKESIQPETASVPNANAPAPAGGAQ